MRLWLAAHAREVKFQVMDPQSIAERMCPGSNCYEVCFGSIQDLIINLHVWQADERLWRLGSTTSVREIM